MEGDICQKSDILSLKFFAPEKNIKNQINFQFCPKLVVWVKIVGGHESGSHSDIRYRNMAR